MSLASTKKKWAEQTLGPVTADNLGNQHGFRCPRCKQGDQLRIAATIWADLLPDGTDSSDSDTEWDDTSEAQCSSCDWSGTVADLLVVEILEGKEENDGG